MNENVTVITDCSASRLHDYVQFIFEYDSVI